MEKKPFCNEALILRVESDFIVHEDYLKAGQDVIILFYSDNNFVSLYRANGAPIAERIKMKRNALLEMTNYDDFKKSKLS